MLLSKYIKLWPLTHIYGFLNLNSESSPIAVKPYMDHPLEYITKIIQMLPYLLISWVCVTLDPLE